MATAWNRCVLLAALLFVSGVASGGGDAEWNFGGDVRAGYFEGKRTARDGTRSQSGDYRLRLRLAAEHRAGDRWQLRGRVAGRYGSEQGRHRFYLRGYAPTATGTELGNTTIDEFYSDYHARHQPWSLRVGRFQTQFSLKGVASKGLDRNDSPNVDVTWTDGVHFRYQVLPEWRGHVVLQHNHRRGPGSALRAPLDFSDSESRVALFSGLQATQSLGPIVQRELGVTWMRSALATRGVDRPERDDYLAFVMRGAASWSLDERGRRLVPGVEVGYAPNTPRSEVTGTADAGDAGGVAWQAALSLYEILPGHHLGLVHARTDAGWLLSGDFRGNDALSEVRYQWVLSPRLSFEARYRHREERRIPLAAERRRDDRDFYLRLSGRF